MRLFFTKAKRDLKKKKLRSIPIILIITIGGIVCILYSSLYLNWVSIEESSWDDLHYHDILLTVKPTNVSSLNTIINNVIEDTSIRVDYELRSFFEYNVKSIHSENLISSYLYGIDDQLSVDDLFYHPGFIDQLDEESVEAELVVDKVTAEGENWNIGDILSIETPTGILNATLIAFVESPEFMIAPGLVAEFYGDWDGPIIWVTNNVLSTFLNTTNHINQVVFSLESPNDKNRFLDRILSEFERNFGSDYVLQINGRNLFLSAIGPTFSVMGIIFIFVFSGIAAIMIFIVLKRVIEEELSILGLFKSMGFTNREIISSAVIYAWMIGSIGSFSGAIIGSLIGITAGDSYIKIAGIKMLPTITNNIIMILPLFAVLYIIMTLIFTTLGALVASRKVIKLSPMESMRPQALLNPGKLSIVEKGITKVYKYLSPLSKFSIRSIFQEKRKTSFIVFGLILATAISFFGSSIGTSFSSSLNKQFDYYQAWDAQIYLSTYENNSEIPNLLAGINYERYEPFIITPIRLKQDRTQIHTILGLKANTIMRRFDGGKFPSLNEIAINKDIAIKLGISIDSNIGIYDIRGEESTLRVSNVLNEMIGSGLYTSLDTARKLAKLNGTDLVNGIYLKSADIPNIKALSNNSLVSEVIIKSELAKSMKEVGQLGVSWFMYGATSAALIVGVSITITIVSITISERKHSFINFRALGVSNREIFRSVLLELVLAGIVGIFLGLVFGYILVETMFLWAATFGVVFVLELSIFDLIISIATVFCGMIISTYLSLRSLFRSTISEETVSRVIG